MVMNELPRQCFDEWNDGPVDGGIGDMNIVSELDD
jgi:hypothetical protein